MFVKSKKMKAKIRKHRKEKRENRDGTPYCHRTEVWKYPRESAVRILLRLLSD
jgi:hypothetical protein